MKISCVAFTKKGKELKKKIEKYLKNLSHSTSEKPEDISLKEWCRLCFQTMDGIIFIGGTSIAVRTIAPFIRSREEDPAVLVIDDGGNFVISLLSGHTGGANRLTQEISRGIEATPVITTSTDINSTISINRWALKNGMVIDDIRLIKFISMALMHNEPIGVYSCLSLNKISEPLVKIDSENTDMSLGICIDWKGGGIFDRELLLIPKRLVLGIECGRSKCLEGIKKCIYKVLEEFKIDERALAEIVAVDLKEDEESLRQLSKEIGIPLITLTYEELSREKEKLSSSNFVSSTVGTDSICRTAVALRTDGGKILVEKYTLDGVTVSIGFRKEKINII